MTTVIDIQPRKAPRHGQHYSDSEIAVCWFTFPTPEGRRRLAAQLGRTEHAISFIWRWCDDPECFPPGAHNRIMHQIERCRENLGEQTRGEVIYE